MKDFKQNNWLVEKLPHYSLEELKYMTHNLVMDGSLTTSDLQKYYYDYDVNTAIRKLIDLTIITPNNKGANDLI